MVYTREQFEEYLKTLTREALEKAYLDELDNRKKIMRELQRLESIETRLLRVRESYAKNIRYHVQVQTDRARYWKGQYKELRRKMEDQKSVLSKVTNWLWNG